MSPLVQRLKVAPPSDFFYSPTTPSTDGLTPIPTGPYFFYGTLSDPSLLSEILDLSKNPELKPAYLVGYRCMMWGQYPALMDAPGMIVKGVVYHVCTQEDGEKLATYETNSYRVEACRIRYFDDKEPSDNLGYTFKFAGNVNDLEEGDFDLTAWLSRIGRETAVDGPMVAKKESASCREQT
ncbi:uncharacterized protein N7496_007544 [Penicillium cataractarum]|uniref:Putative gamma-glutamylcyclotransferase n=1 Tax=Penicillium cataractarum TaxID=2100454 RepID=A0A9W9S3M9_9EURO|nr:uncharacterized protein N7496_007544 [Penicillium cataractarum]KAJ5371452.1 hypothetical protein N7496_007544 [Penicillium cataractarum]